MGIYPMLQDETCFVLAVDFDKEGWRDDTKAFCETCRYLNVPAALERSRSGNGAHVWIFFDEAIPATLRWCRAASISSTSSSRRRPRREKGAEMTRPSSKASQRHSRLRSQSQ